MHYHNSVSLQYQSLCWTERYYEFDLWFDCGNFSKYSWKLYCCYSTIHFVETNVTNANKFYTKLQRKHPLMVHPLNVPLRSMFGIRTLSTYGNYREQLVKLYFVRNSTKCRLDADVDIKLHGRISHLPLWTCIGYGACIVLSNEFTWVTGSIQSKISWKTWKIHFEISFCIELIPETMLHLLCRIHILIWEAFLINSNSSDEQTTVGALMRFTFFKTSVEYN